MKMALMVTALIAAAAFVGCKKSEEGGGAGNETFKVVVPAMTTDVKQGEVQIVKVSIERGSGFKDAVKLQTKAPAGISVDPDSTTVKAGDKGDVQLKVTAAKDASLGEAKIELRGTPDKGEAVEIEFKVNVIAK
jgi:uncharacterized membrane protein